jgi:photosystem II stability/assembly factor-like uncharacterized protein
MSDERFERDLRDELLRGVPTSAPADVRARVAAIPDRTAALGAGRSFAPRVLAGLAAALVVVLAGGILVFARPGPTPAPSAGPVPGGAAVRALSATELGSLLSSPGAAGRVIVADLRLTQVAMICPPPASGTVDTAACAAWHIEGLPGISLSTTSSSPRVTSGLVALRVESATRLDLLGTVTAGPDGLAWIVAQASRGGWTLAVVDAWLGAVNLPLPCPAPIPPITPDPYGCGHAEWLADGPEQPTAQELYPANALHVSNGAYAAYAPDPSSVDAEHVVPQRAAYLVRLVPHSCPAGTERLDVCNFLTVVGRIDPIGSGVVTGPVPSATPSSTPLPSAQASAPTIAEVDQFGLVDTTHGWALSRNQLYVTFDGGRTWKWSPALAAGSQIVPAQVDFLDAEHGWLVGWRSDDTGPVTIEQTTDFGRSWQSATIPSALGIPRTIRFFDASRGLLALGAGGGRPGSLWRSADGGATWTQVGVIPAAAVGAISFSDASVGWGLAASDPNPPTGRPTTNELYVTRDGGVTWKRSVLPAPPTGFSASTWQPMIVAPPSVFAPDGAVLAAWCGDGVHGETQLLVTKDAGLTWSVAATLPSLFPVPVDALTAERWIAAIPDGGPAASERLRLTDDGGQTWRPLTDTTPSHGVYLSIDFVDPAHGWVLDNGTPPLALYATDDGAASWRPLSPSGGPVASHRCTVDTVVLGSGGALAPATTPWFNVIVEYFDSSSPIAVTFSAPVVAWPGTPLPTGPLTAFSLPNGGTTKLSFRPADAATSTITVTASGGGCSATSSVSLPAVVPPTP